MPFSLGVARPFVTDATLEQNGHRVNADRGRKDAPVLHPETHIYRRPKTISHTWNITKEQLAPDGVIKPVYLINGQFPGPLIEARPGDELVVNVYNSIDDEHEGTSVHWHGLKLKGANDMDGAVGVTQCAIAPSSNFTYHFKIEESEFGTYWYHAHSGAQRADGLYGGLVIHKPADDPDDISDSSLHEYDGERLLMIGDWFHRPASDVLQSFEDPLSLGNEPTPDSMLINGRGAYNCSNAVSARPVNCTIVERPILSLPDSSRVRLRVINAGTSAGFTLSTTHDTMNAITVDGGYLLANNTPAAGSIGILYPGERMDLVIERGRVTTDQDAELVVTLDRENMRMVNFALTEQQGFPLQWGTSRRNALKHESEQRPTSLPHLSLTDVNGATIDVPPSFYEPAERAVLYSTMQIRSANHNKPVGTVNRTSRLLPNPVQEPLLSMDRERWVEVVKQPVSTHKFMVPWFREAGDDRWIELVLNNFDDKGHPFHMHGNSFYIVATHFSELGPSMGYNPFDASARMEVGKIVNEVNPLRKDTVYVPPMGFAVVRFPLDNEGLWLLHCHVLWHQMIGMGIVLQVGEIREDVKARASIMCPIQRR